MTTKPLKPINAHLSSVTLQDLENHKQITTKQLQRDLENLNKFDATTNKNNFAGNPFLYHYQFKNLLKCRRQDGKTIYDIYNDSAAWAKLIDNTRQRNRGGRAIVADVQPLAIYLNVLESIWVVWSCSKAPHQSISTRSTRPRMC